MNNYKNVIIIAKDLQEEFKDKITVAESLQIAAQINLAECLADGLQTGVSGEPAFLEAIAMSLGFAPKSERSFKRTIAESVQGLLNKE